MKRLLLDVETSPNTAYVWGLWKQNIGINQLIESSNLLCFSAKWLGAEEVIFSSLFSTGKKRMIKKLHKLLDEADAVIHYNGAKFDIPVVNKEFLLLGYTPPAPYKQIDLLKVARNKFRFTSNKLDYVAQQLGVGRKVKHQGFELWVKCMQNDPQAWEQMEEYNIQDVNLLESVYNKLLPWIHKHPNVGLYSNSCSCTNCGSDNLRRRGFTFTNSGKYQRFRCNDCGSWCRKRTTEKLNEEILTHD